MPHPHFCREKLAKWASSWDYGTYHIGDQWRFRRPCSSAQSRQSLRCSHTRSMKVDEGSNQKSDIQPHWMAAHAHLKNECMGDKKCHNLMSWLKCHQISCMTPKFLTLWIWIHISFQNEHGQNIIILESVCVCINFVREGMVDVRTNTTLFIV